MPCGEPGPVFALVNASTDATLAASYFITQAYGRREDVGRDTSFAPELSRAAATAKARGHRARSGASVTGCPVARADRNACRQS